MHFLEKHHQHQSLKSVLGSFSEFRAFSLIAKQLFAKYEGLLLNYISVHRQIYSWRYSL